MKAPMIVALAGLTLALAACTTTAQRAGPIEVTRFVDQSATARLGVGTLFVETAESSPETGQALVPFKSAVARELARLGYTESGLEQARQVAQISVERVQIDARGRRGPVSVGVGGTAGSFGTGVGLGVGLNLSGGGGARVVTRMSVFIRDRETGESLWEGRAILQAGTRSPYAASESAAPAIAEALFRDFPGLNGETLEIEVPQ